MFYAWVRHGAPRPDGPPPWPGRLLKLQTPLMRGNDVMGVQRWLNRELGPDIDADGIYGPKTEASVRAYQKLKKLAVDGIVGRLTWESLAR